VVVVSVAVNYCSGKNCHKAQPTFERYASERGESSNGKEIIIELDMYYIN